MPQGSQRLGHVIGGHAVEMDVLLDHARLGGRTAGGSAQAWTAGHGGGPGRDTRLVPSAF
jgi:hypothetical protein